MGAFDYVFNCAPWHAVCRHWQVNSNRPLASAQVALQYFFPSAGTQLQAGCAHLDAAFMKAPLRYCILERIRTRTLQKDYIGESNKSVLFCSSLKKTRNPSGMTTFLSKTAQLFGICRQILFAELR
jgi:hypothetical protein